jgi:hypothetical protein
VKTLSRITTIRQLTDMPKIRIIKAHMFTIQKQQKNTLMLSKCESTMTLRTVLKKNEKRHLRREKSARKDIKKVRLIWMES